MTLFEVAFFGTFFCFLLAVIGRALLQIAEASDHPWAGKIALVVALVLTIAITWAVDNMPEMGGVPAMAAYPEATDWRGYSY